MLNNENTYITVLMPVYNAADFVADAIESILTQSYCYFEFLIIDDGSTDNTLSIINSYKDPRINLVIHDENKGLQETLNEGIRLASYELIARMDADDVSHPWRLEKQVAYMLAHPDCAMVDCWVKVMDKDKNFIRAEGIYSKFVYYTLTFECCIYHSTVMYRKNDVLSIGGYMLQYAEDYDLFWQLSRSYKIHTIEEHLLWYRVHDQNLNTVAKKAEYDEYSQRLWRRNIRYYMGDNAQFPEAWIACYSYHFGPLLKENDMDAVYKCIAFLDKITAKILSVENPNRHFNHIQYISNFKRKYIIESLASHLPVLQMWKLLVHYHYGKKAIKLTLKRIAKRLIKN